MSTAVPAVLTGAPPQRRPWSRPMLQSASPGGAAPLLMVTPPGRCCDPWEEPPNCTSEYPDC